MREICEEVYRNVHGAARGPRACVLSSPRSETESVIHARQNDNPMRMTRTRHRCRSHADFRPGCLGQVMFVRP